MFEKFTDRARRVVVLAQEESRNLNHTHIGTEHLLLGMLHEGEGLAFKSLDALGYSLGPIREAVVGMIGEGVERMQGHIPFTPRAKSVCELALRESLQLGHNYIGSEHLLLGLIREGEGIAARVLNETGSGTILQDIQVTCLGLMRDKVEEVVPSFGLASTSASVVFPPFAPPWDEVIRLLKKIAGEE